LLFLVVVASYYCAGLDVVVVVVNRVRKLLGVFVLAVLYFVFVYHISNLYATEHHGFEAFMLLGENGGEKYSMIFWIGQILLGSLVPLALIYAPAVANCRKTLTLASLLVVIGGLAQLYTIIIAGQAYPLEMFPGMTILESGFNDGLVSQYSATLPEIMLGLGGVALSLLMIAFGVKVLGFLPASLADSVADPHAKAE